jgi:hypothetical protein
MGANKPGKPDASKIVEHYQAVFGDGLVTPETALDALRQIEDALRREYSLSDEELGPVNKLIEELDGRLGRAPLNESAASPKR